MPTNKIFKNNLILWSDTFFIYFTTRVFLITCRLEIQRKAKAGRGKAKIQFNLR